MFNKAYAGTKLLIEDYITHVALAVDHVATYPIDGAEQHGLSGQAKLDLLHDTRQAFGRSALVLQGGSIFGLCHIGVVKALHLRGLLPRIIVGTGTGALIAALVGIHGEDELLNFLMTEGIDLSAFVERKKKSSTDDTQQPENLKWWGTLLRRLKRLLTDGYFLDIAMLEACVHANVGDMTFEEAYLKTGRVLNITLPTDPSGDIPSLLNYLTAPNVVCVFLSSLRFEITDMLHLAHLVRSRRVECFSESTKPPHAPSFEGYYGSCHALVCHQPHRFTYPFLEIAFPI